MRRSIGHCWPRKRPKTIAARISFVLDMRELTSVFDFFVVASGTSRRQLHAMSEEIDHALEDKMGDHRLGIEGYEESRWILLDYGDVVIHLFEPEMRAYYALEDLWGLRRYNGACSAKTHDEHSDHPQRTVPSRTGRTG